MDYGLLHLAYKFAAVQVECTEGADSNIFAVVAPKIKALRKSTGELKYIQKDIIYMNVSYTENWPIFQLSSTIERSVYDK